MKRSLRVRTEGLRKAEELSIAVFLRFVGQSDRAAWALSHESDAELVLMAADTAPVQQSLPEAERIAWVLGEDSTLPTDGRAVLYRPLQVEAFGELLRRREAQLLLATSVHPAFAASAAEGIHPSLQTNTVPLADAPPPSAAAVKLGSFDAHGAHRLLRWPGTELLQEQRIRKILASFLVSRPLTAQQLASLSGVPKPTCLDFLQALAMQGLLETRAMPADGLGRTARMTIMTPAASLSAALPAASVPATLAASNTRTERAGLIGRLRRRLGLS